jgi:glycosyltransferase involved in cell wall biosynthesis
MHVLIVTNYFAPEGGAAAVRLTRLARQLRRRGHQVTVLTSLPHYPQGEVFEGYRGRLTITTEQDGVRVLQTWLHATPSPRISRKAASQLSFMLSACLCGLRLPTPDVLLVEGQPIFAALAGWFLAAVKRRPYVLNVSDLWPDHLLSVGAMTATHPIYRLARRVTDALYRRARAIVAMSPGWAEAIEARLDTRRNLHVILNGVDLRKCRDDVDAGHFRRKYALDQRKTISFIGTFSTQYDFDAMFRVIASLSEIRDIQAVFVGTGSQEDLVRKFLQGRNNVTWIRWIDHDQIFQAWKASDATFWAMRDHPLYRGTIPAKLYEAMACGVPIVAAMEGSAARIVEESGAGVVVPCGDVDALVRALAEVLDQDALRTAYGAAARRYAEAHFAVDRVADAYERVLLEAAANTPASPAGECRRDGAVTP